VYPDGYLSELTVQLVAQGKVAAQTTASITCASSGDSLFGVLSGSPSAFNVLAELDPQVGNALVAQLEPADVPDYAHPLKALDWLVISDIDTGLLSAAQKGALQGWLAGGGRLLVTGGPDWRKTSAGLQDLLPLLPEDTQNLPAPGPGEAATASIASLADLPGELLAASGTLAEGAEVLASRGGLPLVARRSLGSGEVLYLAFDPALEPVKSWDRLPDFYRELLRQPASASAWASGFQDWALASEAVSTLPSLELPSGWLIVGFLGVYAFAIGPANWIILRRLKRRELAWVSIPVLVLLFSGFAFLLGSGMRGARPVLNRLAVVQVWPGVEQAQVDGLLGLFSPARETYQLEIDPHFLAHALPNNFSTAQSNPGLFFRDEQGQTHIPDLRVDVGGIRTLALEGLAPAPLLDYELALELDQHGGTLRGSLTNQSDLAFQDSVLIAPGKTQHIGSLDPFEQREILLNIGLDSKAAFTQGSAPAYQPYPGSPNLLWTELLGTSDYYRDRETYRRYSLLAALIGYGQGTGRQEEGIYLAGWSSGSPIEAGLGEERFRTADTTLYLIALEPAISFSANSRLTLPPGLFAWSILEPGVSGEASPYETYVSPGGFSLSFHPVFALPPGSVGSLSLHLESYGASGRAGIQVELWDFSTGDWDQIEAVEWGTNDIPSPESFVGPGGEIRLRLNNTSSFGPEQLERADFTLTIEP
jgi:hypothetical protein